VRQGLHGGGARTKGHAEIVKSCWNTTEPVDVEAERWDGNSLDWARQVARSIAGERE